MIFGESNMKDWIIFDEISMRGYSIMMNMELNHDFTTSMLRQIRKHEDTKY